MSYASNPLQTAHGYDAPCVTQFSVFLDNRVGKLLDVVETLNAHPYTQICALSVHEASDYAVVRIITNGSDATRDILKSKRFPFSEKELLIVELVNGHDLASLCLCLLSAELNIHFAYPLLLKMHGAPTIALAVDDITLAGQILRRKEFVLLGEADLPHD